MLVIPVSILGGVIAALKVGKLTDRVITVTGLSLAVVPEFVTGIVLILVFGIWLDLLPVTAAARSASIGFFEGLKYLLLHRRWRQRGCPLRLHRAHGPGGNGDVARLGLHAHGRPQGLS